MSKLFIQGFILDFASYAMPRRVRRRLLLFAGIRIGSKTGIASGLHIVWGGGEVHIGSEVFINRSCFIDARGSVTIEDHVHLADHVRLITSTHEVGPPSRRAGKLTVAPVRIGAGSWLGSGVIVLPGVQIGSGCIIAAGAVVTKDCLMDGLYGGVPARRIKDLCVGQRNEIFVR